MKNKNTPYNIQFAGIVFFLICLLVLVNMQGYGQMKYGWDEYVMNVHSAIEERMASMFESMDQFPGSADKDILFLSSLEDTRNALDQAAQGADYSAPAARLIDIYESFADHEPSYRNFSVVDKDGMEILHADCRTEVCVTAPSAVEWGKESIFDDVQKIPRDTVTGTELILETEPDGEQVSYMYYGTQILDEDGSFMGEIIVSVDAKFFLDDIREFGREGEALILTDHEGRYLSYGDRSKEFMVNQSANLRNDYGQAAKKILTEEGSTFSHDGKIFTFRRIYFAPTGFIDTHSNLSGHYWVLIDIVDQDRAYPNLEVLRREGWLALALFDLILLVSVVLLLLMWRQVTMKAGKPNRKKNHV